VRLWPQGGARSVWGEQRGQEARVREPQRGSGDRGPPDDAARVDGREDCGLEAVEEARPRLRRRLVQHDGREDEDTGQVRRGDDVQHEGLGEERACHEADELVADGEEVVWHQHRVHRRVVSRERVVCACGSPPK